jgi:uncharacterized protein
MDWETALNAINIFMSHSSKAERRNLSFYGGEPLLNFDLIKKVVNYVSEHHAKKNIHYSFTTNGSLFNDENIEFFMNHNFNILVSLNGPKPIHDKYRVDTNGKGTFNRVMQGLQKILGKDKKYYDKNIQFSCVLTPNTNYSELLSFFYENILVKDKLNIALSSIDRFQTSFYEKYGDYSLMQNNYFNKIYYETAINNSLEKEIFIRITKEKSMLKIFRRCNHKMGERIPPNGCCIPLIKKMFIDVDGNIHTCERVPLYNPLGNVNSKGIDYELIAKFVQKYTENSLNDCKILLGS